MTLVELRDWHARMADTAVTEERTLWHNEAAALLNGLEQRLDALRGQVVAEREATVRTLWPKHRKEAS